MQRFTHEAIVANILKYFLKVKLFIDIRIDR